MISIIPQLQCIVFTTSGRHYRKVCSFLMQRCLQLVKWTQSQEIPGFISHPASKRVFQCNPVYKCLKVTQKANQVPARYSREDVKLTQGRALYYIAESCRYIAGEKTLCEEQWSPSFWFTHVPRTVTRSGSYLFSDVSLKVLFYTNLNFFQYCAKSQIEMKVWK